MEQSAFRRWALLVAFGLVLLCARASEPDIMDQDIRTPAVLLAQAEELRSTDYPRFVDILEQLRRDKGHLTPAQQWHFKYLETQSLAYKDDYDKAIPILQDIVDHSGSRSLAARATARLIQANFLRHQYEQAYVLANKLMVELPQITDRVARLDVLIKVIQMLNSVRQNDLALIYARQIKASFPSAKGQCEGNLSVTQTMQYAGMLTSDSPDYQETIESCLGAGLVVSANALRLDLANLLNQEGHPEKAIILLRQIAPSIYKAEYKFHIASLHVTFARAYEMLRDDTNARKSALAALAANNPDAVNWTVREANEVLSKVAKRRGDAVAALSYYEKYVTQKQNSADDAKARALAYQMVKQDVLAKEMTLDALSKENKILQLRQSLADKASETGRLYIALLLVVIVFIVFWLYRIKHSQLRFRRLSQHDGMTGTFNRKHFLDVASQSLQRLQGAHESACLVLLDLDYFKQVNDNHGHAAGDEVLKRTVNICRQELRESDLFGRLGGEEFGILMPSCSCEQGEEVANRIRSTLASARIVLDSGKLVKVSASFGLACSSVSGYVLPHLLGVADAALYRAKGGGRNQLVVGADKDEHGMRSNDGRTTAQA